MAEWAQRCYSTGNEWERAFGYSRAVRVGPHIAVTGTVSVSDDGSLYVPDDGRAQASRCFAIIKAALHEVGGSLDDVTRIRMFVTDIERSVDFGAAFRDYFGEINPCLTMVEVARLIDPRLLVEVEADAIVRDQA